MSFKKLEYNIENGLAVLKASYEMPTVKAKMVITYTINGEGEIVIATDEGKFKRVISALIEPSKRYRKGNIIVSLKEGASVLSASYVTEPYMLAVVSKTKEVSELSTEDVSILSQSNRAQKIARYKEGSVEAVIPMPYKKGE